eukprot:gene5822-9645_t
MDPNSCSNIHQIKILNLDLNLKVNFDTKELSGFVEIKAKCLEKNIKTISLDIRKLNIEKVESSKKKELSYEIIDKTELGSNLKIDISSIVTEEESFSIFVFYRTRSDGEAIQWLSPKQTIGKKYPYLFSQCQAIHARTMIPCFDTPSAKAPYTAKITCQKPLVVVMSAENIKTEEINDKEITYHFSQDIPIPSYLIAIGVGKLEKIQIGPRSVVWSEKEMLEKSKFEFSQTEEFLKIAESFLIPYQWKNYDLLLLPPSFPYGGMENTALTFVTPTLLAGDRSLANVVAHEISHSWSGNLVTNTTWEHFWLNEGFTVYLERRILSRMISQEYAEFHSILGLKSLKKDIENQIENGHEDYTKMIPNLKNVDPDDVFSRVPYEKGFNFLYYLTTIVGGFDIFEKFLSTYFNEFKFKCLTSDEFKTYFLNYFKNINEIKEIDWNSWFYSTGMPPVQNKFNDILSKNSIELASRWSKNQNDNFSKNDLENWSTIQILYFLEQFFESSNIDDNFLERLDEIYSFSTKNFEIKFQYFMLCLKFDYKKIIPLVEQMLSEQGRMKFVRPLYRSLKKLDKQIANDIFNKYKDTYHGIASKMIENDLK